MKSPTCPDCGETMNPVLRLNGKDVGKFMGSFVCRCGRKVLAK